MDATKVLFGNYLYQMNFMLHISDDNIDIFDNPYFEIKPYIMDDNVNFVARKPNNGELKLI